MNTKVRIKNILFSMRTAIILLLILTVACVIGSVLPQGELEAYYTGYYPEKAAWLILLLNLDDVFHSIWFLVLTICLCLNLLGCNLIRFPQLMKTQSKGFTLERRLAAGNQTPDLITPKDPVPLFEALHFKKLERSQGPEGEKRIYGARNTIGIWGAWLTHLGMLIIIVGFALGQIFTVKYTVYGIVGETLDVEGTDYALTINDFQTLLREDETVDQYISNLTLTNKVTGEAVTGDSSVNHPLQGMGLKLYQNSTGWASRVQILKNRQPIQSQVLCAGEHMTIEDMPDLVLAFNAFYPDFVMDGNTPATSSSQLNNPAYLYTLYYQGEVLGMNVLKEKEMITVEDYNVIFTDPQPYTLIQIKHDPYTGIALIGAILILIALFLSFYIRAEELWAVQDASGFWTITGYSRKGDVLYHEKIQDRAAELAMLAKDNTKEGE